MDFAALVTKEEADRWYTAEIIVDGVVVKSAQYATEASALKFITLQTTTLQRTGRINPND